MAEESLDKSLSAVIDKVSGAIEKAANEHGDQAVDLALTVGRVAAIQTIAVGLFCMLIAGVLGGIAWRALTLFLRDRNEFYIPVSIFSAAGAILVALLASTKLFAIHAWVGLFHPEVYLAYEAVF